MVRMFDHRLALTLDAVRRQLHAMPWHRYELRLIHHATRRPWPGRRLWSAAQILDLATVKFLRWLNRSGYDIYLRPYAGHQNAGYILLDLDRAEAGVMDTMRSRQHDPCLVVASSPGHLQAWIRVSHQPLPAPLATQIARALAQTYQADPASADWRHLGRLAGFTNQKPQRRQLNGLAPWVRILHAQPCQARHPALLAGNLAAQAADRLPNPARLRPPATPTTLEPASPLSPAQATAIYESVLLRLGIRQRFPQPDWSVADKWVAKQLLHQGAPLAQAEIVLRFGSPGFPRAHPNPADYLRRTLARAWAELQAPAFSARPRSGVA